MTVFPNINRTAVIIVGKQSFYDWVNKVFPEDDSMTLDSVVEYNSYLLESYSYFEEPKEALKNYWKTIFENELTEMCTDKNEWPEMSWRLFNSYFQCHFSSMVYDLDKSSLKREILE